MTRKKAEKEPKIVLVKPPKDIGDMTDAELLEFSGKLWKAVKEAKKG